MKAEIRSELYDLAVMVKPKQLPGLKMTWLKLFPRMKIAVQPWSGIIQKKITTTIREVMGKKTGTYATDEDQAEMGKRMDSLMQSRGGQNGSFSNKPATYSVAYIDENKKIAGFACKKALIVAARSNRSDTTTVWYCPEFKLQNLPNTGGIAGGFGGINMSAGSGGMELLNGFPMQYERNMPGGRHMTVEVTKLITDKEIAGKEFEIPKEIEVKAMKDMQGGGGPGFQIRMIGQ